ncbi:GTPase ObgE [Candidatus Gracilibacteria bacterium]|nr:MAG: GTPase ObgE [Candidatus Gracilibacteria bacterium]
MFIDEVKLKLISGKGGDGIVSWRREKYIPKGGPWGGDGGKGGDVYIETDSNLNTLSDYRHKKVIKADSGESGGTNQMHGSDAQDLILRVPVGTIVKDTDTGEVIADLDEENLRLLILKGGKGGFGNSHFCSSTRQAPAFAELGDEAQEKNISLELKLVADIGIIGVPSAGKSSLISVITNVKPKIGDYPFTTLVPNLGVLEHKGKNLVLEDVPGLIPGAHEGKGLGINFLKHIERTGVLLHLLDLYKMDQIFQDYEDIRKELEYFSPELAKKEEIIGLSKADLLDSEMKKFILGEFKKRYPNKKVFIISSATGEGVEELKDYFIDNFAKQSEETDLKEKNIKIISLFDDDSDKDARNTVLKYLGNYEFEATGNRIEQIVRMTDFSNPEAVSRVIDVLEKIGIMKKIESKLNKISEEEKLDNSSFFEGNDSELISPKLFIAGREISLDKLRYNL